jgi:hypothetical protein
MVMFATPSDPKKKYQMDYLTKNCSFIFAQPALHSTRAAAREKK